MPYQPGDIILNKYQIKELLGKGAFAEVYRATHTELGVSRALKILHRETAGVGSSLYDDYQKRFRLEVRLGARLNHTNVIHVYDVEHEEGALILVMEYAAGGSLAERVQRAREVGKTFDVEEALRIAAQVADGLGKLHALDAVHRDLKPSNILFDREWVAKIADFGLAQVPGGPSMRSRLSQPVHHPGTAGYMSPEQETTTQFLKPTSDVYALGLITFELLTGRNYNYVKPGTRARELRPDSPAWVEALLARMLAQDPGERPWDGKAAAKLLREGLAREEEERRAEESARQESQAKARRQAEEKARKKEAQRQAEIERLQREAHAALSQEAWSRAEGFLKELRELGPKGKQRAEELRKKLAQAQEGAQRRKRQEGKRQAEQLATLKAKIESTLREENWGQAKGLITHLESLGPEGHAAADSYRRRIPSLWSRIPTWAWAVGVGALLLGIGIGIVLIINALVGGTGGAPLAAKEEITPAPTITIPFAPTLTSTLTPTDTPEPALGVAPR